MPQLLLLWGQSRSKDWESAWYLELGSQQQNAAGDQLFTEDILRQHKKTWKLKW